MKGEGDEGEEEVRWEDKDFSFFTFSSQAFELWEKALKKSTFAHVHTSVHVHTN